MDTQKSWEIPLLNIPTINELAGSRLPTKMEVFRFFMFLQNIASLQLYSAKREAVNVACKFWSQVGLQTKKIDCGIRDLTKIHEEYKVIFGNVVSSPVFLILVLPTKGMYIV